eukprot:1154907-Pelagomonas_calceolata.AAC.1
MAFLLPVTFVMSKMMCWMNSIASSQTVPYLPSTRHAGPAAPSCFSSAAPAGSAYMTSGAKT